MLNGSDSTDEPTRRQAIKYGGTVTLARFLAGCTGRPDSQSRPDATDDEVDAETESSSDDQSTWRVAMEPSGPVEFDSVPERWLPYSAGYADAGVALGQADGMVGVGQTAEYYTHFYEELPGVSVDTEALTELVPNDMSKVVLRTRQRRPRAPHTVVQERESGLRAIRSRRASLDEGPRR